MFSRTDKVIIVFFVLVIVALSFLLFGCVKTTRVQYDQGGKKVAEETSWEPSVVTVYGGPVVYTGGQYYDQYGPVGYVEPYRVYRRPVVVYDRPVRHGRTVYVDRHSHHHRR